MADTQYVSLCVDTETFAVPVAMVREILDYKAPHPFPEAPDFFLGIIDVRGHAVPVADLRLRLGMAPRAPDTATRILVLDMPASDKTVSLGLAADRVQDVVTINQEDVQAPYLGGSSVPGYITGVSHLNDGFVTIIDPEKLFANVPSAADA